MKPETVKKLREITGCGLMQCKNALELFNGNIAQAHEFLRIHGDAVCRRRQDGTIWQLQDYVEYVKSYIKEDEKVIKYWNIHVTYDNIYGEGYSIFLKSDTSMNENEAVQEAIDNCMFQKPEDLDCIAYIAEISKDEYEESLIL